MKPYQMPLPAKGRDDVESSSGSAIFSNAIFRNHLRSDSNELGILGNVSGHYGVVETNGRGMLHLHSLIWLSGNFTFEDLRVRVLNDTDFRQRLIAFLESIIINTVEQALTDTDILPDHNIPSFPNVQTDENFEQLCNF
jgi:helitron helicase-like protein